jgi:DNA repair protein RadA/Sms
MAKARSVWRCQQCGHTAAKWLGQCPGCGEIGTLVEEAETAKAVSASRASGARPLKLAEVALTSDHRTSTGIAEFDRVLGGGLVRGSLVLLGGEPGIGKSTLLLQAAASLARGGASVLYVCGEESPTQVRMRAERVGGCEDNLQLLPEVDVSVVEGVALRERPQVLVVDSIQTAFDPELTGVPGSVGQVRAATARLMRLAKDEGVTTLIVGHVTKEGAIAGPRVLEHMVDTVLYFEGDRDHAFRVVRAVKNRFGSVSEIGVFEMGESGLAPVGSPSAALLAERPEGVAGSVVMATVEGSRPLLVEVQALVTPSYLQMPRRLATGVELSRVLQVLAVLERRAGMRFGDQDVYVSVAGGVKVSEPAVDLPLALALASARRDAAVPAATVAFGELGLAGELRPVPHVAARLKEASQLGFGAAITGNVRGLRPDGIDLRTASSVRDAVAMLG